MTTGTPCPGRFTSDQDNKVTTDPSEIRVGLNLWQKQSDITIEPKAFASRYSMDAEKNC